MGVAAYTPPSVRGQRALSAGARGRRHALQRTLNHAVADEPGRVRRLVPVQLQQLPVRELQKRRGGAGAGVWQLQRGGVRVCVQTAADQHAARCGLRHLARQSLAQPRYTQREAPSESGGALWDGANGWCARSRVSAACERSENVRAH